MYNIILYVLSYSLPPINNVYSGTMYLSLLGKQNIEFERLKKNTSQVRLRGLINCRGFIYNENENENENVNRKLISKNENVKDYMKYELDNNLKNIMNKYSCSIDAPLYDNINDEILFVLKINMLGLTKHINLINTKNRNIKANLS